MENSKAFMAAAGFRGGFARGALVFLFYGALALPRLWPALSAGSGAAAAADTPDLWMHLWAFWRAGFALAGRDAGYLTSHLLTFPAVVREPIAACDPLLPLMAAAARALVPALPALFNLLTLCGLAATGFAGYLLGSRLAQSRPAGLIAGAIMAFNPFLGRIMDAAFIEFAWCGLIPLALWFMIRHAETGQARHFFGHLVSLLSLFLMSIYCAAFYALIAAAVAPAAILRARVKSEFRPRLRRALTLQAAGAAVLLPIFALWLGALSDAGFKEAPLGRPFVIPAFRAAASPDIPLTPEARCAPPPPIPRPAKPARPQPVDEGVMLRWRTLYTSVDLGDLVSLRGSAAPRPLEGLFNPPALQPRAHAVFLREWLPALALAGLALGAAATRRRALWIAGLGAVFFALALGPYPIVNGRVLAGPALPYAWLYQWLPGFSRLYMPGRAFLGAALCLAMLAALGASRLFHGHGLASAPRAQYLLAAGVALLMHCFPAWVGAGGVGPAVTRVAVPALYEILEREPGGHGALELPIGPDIYRRTFFQTVHRKPIFKGAIPEAMIPEYGADAVLANPLVRLFNEPPAAAEELPTPDSLMDGCRRLRGMGFRHLVFHAGALPDSRRAEAVRGAGLVLLGPPLAEDGGILLWRLPACPPEPRGAQPDPR